MGSRPEFPTTGRSADKHESRTYADLALLPRRSGLVVDVVPLVSGGEGKQGGENGETEHVGRNLNTPCRLLGQLSLDAIKSWQDLTREKSSVSKVAVGGETRGNGGEVG